MKLRASTRGRLRPGVVVVIATAAVGLTLGIVGFTRALAATSGAIIGYGGKCVDVAGASSANGTRVQLYTCNGTNAQQWTVGADNTIRALGRCLDVAAAGIANGTRVQLWDCNGTGAQRWTATAGQLINPNATIQSRLNSVFSQQQSNQFGTNRYALLFKPGSYNVDVNVGFYPQVLGLG